MRTQAIKLKKGLLLLTIAVSTLSSCKLVHYPTSFNTPVLDKKGDMQATGVIGLGNIEVQGAYALTNSMGLSVTGSYFSEEREIEVNNETVKVSEQSSYLEGGLGYYGQIGEFGKYSIFAGAGVGRVPADFRNSFYDGVQTALRKKIFVQPSIAFTSNFADIVGVLRLSSVTINRETNLFAEPGVVLLLGYKNIKFYADAGLSLGYHHAGSLTWDHSFIIFGLGMQINFNLLQ